MVAKLVEKLAKKREEAFGFGQLFWLLDNLKSIQRDPQDNQTLDNKSEKEREQERGKKM